jgi:quercetin dioxygenase-like cupin family protein
MQMLGETDIPMKYVEKGWGHELWVVNSPEYCGKLLFMAKGKKLSWHYHILKDETFYVQSGKVRLLYGDTDDISQCQERLLHPGENFHVYRGLRHRLLALEDSNIFEFSTQHFDSDSLRVIPGD